MLNEVKHPAEQACHHGFFADAQNDIRQRISDSPSLPPFLPVEDYALGEGVVGRFLQTVEEVRVADAPRVQELAEGLHPGAGLPAVVIGTDARQPVERLEGVAEPDGVETQPGVLQLAGDLPATVAPPGAPRWGPRL